MSGSQVVLFFNAAYSSTSYKGLEIEAWSRSELRHN
jgi:hypothetical protein